MPPSLPQMVRVFGRIGLLSFGGPAAQIALMHRELVERRDWLSEAQFLRALSFCMLLPGPEAMQLATYAGWRQRGVPGGLIAGGLFVLPGALVICVLALGYGRFGAIPAVQALFVGVQATIVVIVIAALRKVTAKALVGPGALGLAIASFIALFAFAVPFPVVIVLAACLGSLRAPGTGDTMRPTVPGAAPLGRILGIGGLLWAAPLGLALLLEASFLTDIGLFFSKLAVVTFGGAYAVLAYMTQTVVADYGWLSTAQMMDALGLAETTPGPLILVTQFVAMIAGLAQGGVGLALLAGGLTLWVTFVPCFIWIFAGAPFIDWLAGQPRLQAALAGITAAVVGVIANLALWFALHVFFGQFQAAEFGPLSMILPDLSTVKPLPVLLAGAAAAMMFWRKWDMLVALPACAGLALIAHLADLA